MEKTENLYALQSQYFYYLIIEFEKYFLHAYLWVLFIYYTILDDILPLDYIIQNHVSNRDS